MANMLRMALRAALLRRETYREAAESPEVILKSLGVVIFAATFFGLGLMNVIVEGTRDPELPSIVDRLINLWLVIITLMLGWILWALVVHILGGKFVDGKASFHQVLRALGICYGPGALMLFVRVPQIGGYVYFVGLLWILVAGVVAVREVEQTDWIAATLSTVFGWAVFLLLLPQLFVIPLVG